MELGRKIEEYLGDRLYDELDVTEIDRDALPAFDFYGKVERSCRELRPDIIDELETGEEGTRGPWKTFDDEKKARKFCFDFAKGKFGLCLKVMDDIFWNDHRYKVNTSGSFREMRDIYLNRCREEGRKSFMRTLVKGDRKQVLAPGVAVSNMVAFMMGFSPRYFYQYCRVNRLMRYDHGIYVIDNEF